MNRRELIARGASAGGIEAEPPAVLRAVVRGCLEERMERRREVLDTIDARGGESVR